MQMDVHYLDQNVVNLDGRSHADLAGGVEEALRRKQDFPACSDRPPAQNGHAKKIPARRMHRRGVVDVPHVEGFRNQQDALVVGFLKEKDIRRRHSVFPEGGNDLFGLVTEVDIERHQGERVSVQSWRTHRLRTPAWILEERKLRVQEILWVAAFGVCHFKATNLVTSLWGNATGERQERFDLRGFAG